MWIIRFSESALRYEVKVLSNKLNYFLILLACGDVDKEMSESDNTANLPQWKRIFNRRLKFFIWSLIVALFISIGFNVLLYFMFYSCDLSSAKDLMDKTAQVQHKVAHASSTNRTFDAQVENLKAIGSYLQFKKYFLVIFLTCVQPRKS